MTDSSTEKPAELVATPGTEPKVPVAAIAKERADKREARAEADALKQELAETKKRTELDMQALVESLGPFVADMVTKATEQALKPVKDEAALLKTAMSLGLNEEQAGELAKLKAETPGLTDARALAILRAEKSDLFAPVSRQGTPPITGFSPSGNSPFRQQAPKEDFMAKMLEAQKAKDGRAAQQFATMELFRRVNEIRGKV